MSVVVTQCLNKILRSEALWCNAIRMVHHMDGANGGGKTPVQKMGVALENQGGTRLQDKSTAVAWGLRTKSASE